MLKSQSRVVPKLRDVHVAALFLEAADCLSMGTDDAMSPCWELFHTELFHFLCQNSGLTTKYDCLNFRSTWPFTKVPSEH